MFSARKNKRMMGAGIVQPILGDHEVPHFLVFREISESAVSTVPKEMCHVNWEDMLMVNYS